MLTCYLNRLPKITWLVSETTGRYSQPFSLFAFVLTSFVSHTIQTYHGLICGYGFFRPYSAIQAERMVTNLKQTLYPTLIVVSLSMPLSMCSSFFSPIECPDLLVTYYDLKEWDFFLKNNNTEKAKLICSSQEVSECLINTGWSE